MYANSVRCSNCGAPLSSVPGPGGLVCTFCGTLNQMAPAMRGAPMPGPYWGAPGGAPVRSGAGAGCLVAAAVVGVLVMMGGVAAVVFMRGTASAPAVAPPTEATATAAGGGGTGPGGGAEWEGVHGVILTDVNGDGTPDIVGRLRYVLDGDRATLAAFDGNSAKKLWESENIGTYTDEYQGVLGLADDTVLLALPAGELRAYGLKDGKRLWSGSLPEKASSFCKGSAGQVVVRLADKTNLSVSLADGQAAAPSVTKTGGPAAAAGGACARLPDDGKGGDPTFTVSDEGYAVSVQGMSVEAVVQRPGGPRIAIGQRTPGSEVPMIAALFPDASRNWKSDLAATRPLDTSPQFPSVAAVTADRAYTFYGFTSGGDKPKVLVSFDLAGHRQWEATMPDDMPIEDVRATDTKVFVSQWGHLNVYGAADGKQVFLIGTTR